MQLPRELKVRLDSQTRKLIEKHSTSTQQYGEMVQRVLSKKQSQINEEISKLNRDHLLTLQKKVLVIEKKDQQIIKLNSTITQVKNEMHQCKKGFENVLDENIQLRQLQKALKRQLQQQSNTIKQLKSKKQKLKQQLQNNKLSFSKFEDDYMKLERDYRKMQEKLSQHTQTANLLIKNTQNMMTKQFQDQLTRLKLQKKQKQTQLQGKIKSQRKKYLELDNKNKQLQQNLIFTRNKLQEVTGKVKQIPEISQKQTQTIEQIRKQKIYSTIGLMINLLCPQCLQLKAQIEKFQQSNEFNAQVLKKTKLTNSIQTQTEQLQQKIEKKDYCQKNVQTTYKFLDVFEEKKLLEGIFAIKCNLQRQLSMMKTKYQQLQYLYMSRPIRPEDKKLLRDYEYEKKQLQIKCLQKDQELDNKMVFINYIMKQNQNLKQKKNLEILDTVWGSSCIKEHNPFSLGSTQNISENSFQNEIIRLNTTSFNYMSSKKKYKYQKNLTAQTDSPLLFSVYKRRDQFKRQINTAVSMKKDQKRYRKFSLSKKKLQNEYTCQ